MNLYPNEPMYNHLSNLSWLQYQQNNLPTNQDNFVYPQTLTSTNKNDSTVICLKKGIQNQRDVDFRKVLLLKENNISASLQ